MEVEYAEEESRKNVEQPFDSEAANIDSYRVNPPTPITPMQPAFAQDAVPNYKLPLSSDSVVMSDEMSNDLQKVPTIHYIEVDEDATATTATSTSAHDNKSAVTVQEASRNYFVNDSLVELGRYSWIGRRSDQRFLKGCLWSPDGTCLLTVVNGDGMHVTELPMDLYALESVTDARPVDILVSAVHVREGGIVYDYCWYPHMTSSNASSCCWLASRQHEPIQLWDAFNGELRCTYRGYNAVDEVESALSVSFSNDGQQVIGGFKKTIKIFQTNVPGRDYQSFSIRSPASALAINGTTMAVGSWNGTINLHDQRQLNKDPYDQIRGQNGGITFMRFLPAENYLISGARKDGNLLMWDLRYAITPVLRVKRSVHTNQRIYFDVSENGKWLISGDTTGLVHLWDISNRTSPDGAVFPVHHDCCNGVSIHPSKPILATSSGQHHFPIISELTEDDGITENIAATSVIKENSLIIWWCGPSESSNMIMG